MADLTIYIVEDDPDISELLEFNLQAEGYKTSIFGNGEVAYYKTIESPPDLMILDLNLPGMSGLDVCKFLRKNNTTSDLPIIMLTAYSKESDKVRGLNLGADDYITKPYSIKEVIARVSALLRRTKPAETDVKVFKSVKIDYNSRLVYCNGKAISVTPKEFRLLELFINSKGRLLDRNTIMDEVWGYEYTGETRTVDVHIRRLREKLGECESIIITVKGAGYRLKND